MSKVGVFFAEGFEEVEALTVVDLCRRAGLETDMVSVSGVNQVNGSHGIGIRTDLLISEVDFESLDMIVLPGGDRGTHNLEANLVLMKQVDSFVRQGKMVAAICAAPSILGHKGYLKGRKACCYPSYETHLIGAEVTQNKVEKDKNIITGRGVGVAFDFALEIVEHFCGKVKRVEMEQKTIFRN